MEEILDKLNRVRGVGGSMLISSDGLAMATALRQGSDESAISAGISTLLENALRLCKELGFGKNRAVQVLSAQGGVLVLPAGSAFLTILIDPTANLALLQLEAKPFAERIAQRISL
jgi:uncharacterized protein